MRMTIFWDAAPCTLVEIGRRFIGAYYLDLQSNVTLRTPMMEEVSTSETSLNFYETTRRSIPEDKFFGL
jgi:hypothetical protein